MHQPPKSRCVVWHTTHSEKHREHMQRYIHTHPFNHQVDVIVPVPPSEQSQTLPPFLAQWQASRRAQPSSSSSSSYPSIYQHKYWLVRCDAVVLLRMVLRAAQTGHLVYACTVQQRMDSTNTLCAASTIDGEKCIWNMQLDKDTYEQCGLEGKVASFRYDRLFRARFCIEIDLLRKRSGKHARKWLYAPGRPIYEQLVRSMSRLGEAVVMFAAYNAHKEPVDPRIFIENDTANDGSRNDIVVQLKRISGFGEPPVVSRLSKVQWIPKFISADTGQVVDATEADVMGMLHWLGLVSCGAVEKYDITDGSDRGDTDRHHERPFQSEMQLQAFNSFQRSIHEDEEENAMTDYDAAKQSSSIVHARLRGFIPTFHVESIVQQVREYLKASNGTVEWAAVQVCGMEDSPISWLHCERQYGPVSGENDYCIVLHNDNYEQCWWMSTLGQKDTYS